MKRSGFKRLTFEEAKAKQQEAMQRAIERAKLRRMQPKPFKTKKAERKAERKAKGLPPTKEERVATLKRKLWTIFSRYIRKSWADRNGMVMTADNEYMPWQDSHCGHLYTNSERNKSLGGNELWYYEHNFAPQSMAGNYFNAKDSAKVYMSFAIKRYGQDEVDKMFRMKQTPRQFTEEELQAKYEHYKQLFDKL